MNLRFSAIACSIIVLLAGCVSATAADEKGITCRIEQSMGVGERMADAEYSAEFASNGKFRVEGTIHFPEARQQIKSIVAGNNNMVRQISYLQAERKAIFVDVARIRKALPEADYSPAKTYSPEVYAQLLRPGVEKQELPEEIIDGRRCKGWSIQLKKGRLSLPSNLSFALPDPEEIRVWVAEDRLARKVELYDEKGVGFLKMLYTDVQQDVTIDQARFYLEWPEGVEPIDMTTLILGKVAANREDAARQSGKEGGTP